MNFNAILVGTLGFVLSGLLGILVAYFSFWAFSQATRSLDEVQELKKNNLSVGILLASVILANGLVVKQALFPVVACFRNAFHQGLTVMTSVRAIGYGLVYLALAQLVALSAILFGIHLFARLTRGIDEMAEIRANNVAVAITHGAVIILLGLFLAEGIQGLLAAMVPSPFLETIRTFGL